MLSNDIKQKKFASEGFDYEIGCSVDGRRPVMHELGLVDTCVAMEQVVPLGYATNNNTARGAE